MENEKVDYRSTEISKDVSNLYFKDLMNNDAVLYAVGKRKLDSKVILVIERALGMGGGFSEHLVFLMNEDGERHDKKYMFGQSFGPDNLYDFKFKLVNDSILEVQKTNQEVTTFKYFYVSDNVIVEFSSNLSADSREFVQCSNKLLDKVELTKFNKDELDVMRNEIFAYHGYKFKTPKWQEYFSKQTWYNPRYDDVNEMLSVIEKLNVQTILAVSQSK
ncbi:MAG: YARHG domain-containing protein [Reichenbachiella sp.]